MKKAALEIVVQAVLGRLALLVVYWSKKALLELVVQAVVIEMRKLLEKPKVAAHVSVKMTQVVLVRTKRSEPASSDSESFYYSKCQTVYYQRSPS